MVTALLLLPPPPSPPSVAQPTVTELLEERRDASVAVNGRRPTLLPLMLLLRDMRPLGQESIPPAAALAAAANIPIEAVCSEAAAAGCTAASVVAVLTEVSCLSVRVCVYVAGGRRREETLCCTFVPQPYSESRRIFDVISVL